MHRARSHYLPGSRYFLPLLYGHLRFFWIEYRTGEFSYMESRSVF